MAEARPRTGDPATEPSAIDLVARLLELARARGASDLHVEPARGAWGVRARIDGRLHAVEAIEPALAQRAVARIKVIAGLLTYRTDVPQDGRISAEHAPAGLDVRVATYPTIHGERVLLRFLAAGRRAMGLVDLGLSAPARVGVERYVRHAAGALLVTGPAGSGKTTAMYAILGALLESDRGRHWATIEDPVECELPGVTQTEVDPARGLDFAAALRGLLRHDLDGLLVGEIRDEETARIAVRAALSGHAVLGTIHAGDGAGVFLRLVQMGVPGHMLAAAVRAALALRLAGRACLACGGADPGCAACNGVGTAGRVLVDEWLETSPALAAALVAPELSRNTLARAIGSDHRGLAERARELADEGAIGSRELARLIG